MKQFGRIYFREWPFFQQAHYLPHKAFGASIPKNDPCRYGLFSGTEETVAVPGHLLTFRILFSGDCFFYGTLFT
ncbi:MAG: hypothetical protein ACLSC9_01885 [Barnesiella sp.]